MPKQQHDIKITVLMPAYNTGNYIAEAIRSVLLQTFPAFELLIINDGSTDQTEKIINSFRDERIVLINQENQGVAAALNTGLSHARAPYIARFDADDSCYPQRLETQYKFMTAMPEYIVVGSAVDYMDASGSPVFTYQPVAKTNAAINRLPVHVCPFIHSSVMYRREAVKTIGYDIHAHSFEDHLLWQKLRGVGKMCNLSFPLLKVRLNPGSITMDERKRPKSFHVIKQKALLSGTINADEGEQLLAIIRNQNNSRHKEGAYYSLLAKKFLWNNYDPYRARINVKKAITLNYFDPRDYMLWGISYLPKRIINQLYETFASAR